MIVNTQSFKLLDGDDEIIFSNSFNIYSSSLKIEGVAGLNITFTFDEEGSDDREKDIDISGDGNNAIIIFSSKIRNTLGSGTTGKIEIAEMDIEQSKHKLLFSLYASKIGDKSSALNLSIAFYIRKI